MANNTAPTPPVTENTEETTSLDTVLLVLRRYWSVSYTHLTLPTTPYV